MRHIISRLINILHHAHTTSPFRIHAAQAADPENKHGHLDRRPDETGTGHENTDEKHMKDDTVDHLPLSWFFSRPSFCNAVNPLSSEGIIPDTGGASAENAKGIDNI